MAASKAAMAEAFGAPAPAEDSDMDSPREDFLAMAPELFPDVDPDALWQLIVLCIEAREKGEY